MPENAKQSNKDTYLLYTLVFLMMVVAVFDFFLTVIALDALCLGYGGNCMEVLPQENVVKLMGNVDFDTVYKRDGLVESFKDTPMMLKTVDGTVTFNLQTRQGRLDNKLLVNSSGVFIRGVNLLEVTDPDTLETVFSTLSLEIKVPEGAKTLIAKLLSTKRTASPVDENLTFRSDSSALLRGSEGTRMEANNLYWTADQDIYLKSINGSVILSGKDGVFVDVKYLPIAKLANVSEAVGQYKLCVCMPQGKLFRLPILNNKMVSCNNINLVGELNPCL